MTDPTPDDLATYTAAKLADAAAPIVQEWQETKRFIRSQNDTPVSTQVSAARLDALERALADLYSVVHDHTEPEA